VYGYGYDESYAWGAQAQCATFQSPDTIPPIATFSGSCYTSFVHLADSGAAQSKLAEIRVDSAVNMAYQIDPNWTDGFGTDTGGYYLQVADPDKPALLRVSIFDFAGNRTTVSSVYKPQTADIEDKLLYFGSHTTSDPPTILYDTLIN